MKCVKFQVMYENHNNITSWKCMSASYGTKTHSFFPVKHFVTFDEKVLYKCFYYIMSSFFLQSGNFQIPPVVESCIEFITLYGKWDNIDFICHLFLLIPISRDVSVPVFFFFRNFRCFLNLKRIFLYFCTCPCLCPRKNIAPNCPDFQIFCKDPLTSPNKYAGCPLIMKQQILSIAIQNSQVKSWEIYPSWLSIYYFRESHLSV